MPPTSRTPANSTKVNRMIDFLVSFDPNAVRSAAAVARWSTAVRWRRLRARHPSPRLVGTAKAVPPSRTRSQPLRRLATHFGHSILRRQPPHFGGAAAVGCNFGARKTEDAVAQRQRPPSWRARNILTYGICMYIKLNYIA
jgi:hypothetical protein